MIDRIFDWCVQVLVHGAGMLGITYKEINVWVFVILWPLLTIALSVAVVAQHRRIKQFSWQQ